MNQIRYITLVGVGGVGHLLLPALTELQPDDVTIIDHDLFEDKNIIRQPLARGNIGELKVNVMSKYYGDMFNISGVAAKVQHEDCRAMLATSDLVIAAVDNNNARNHIREVCMDSGIPMIYCANENTSGQAHIIYPGSYNTEIDPWVLYPELAEARESSTDSCSRNPTDQTYATNLITAGCVMQLLRLHVAVGFKPVSGVPSAVYYTLKQFSSKHPHA